jgi:NADPH:quinone reductase-like Zn-dependent oxidoreductase
VRQYGGPDAIRLENVDTPRLAEGEVLVKVEATTVNRARDLAICAGKVVGPEALPLVLGQDPAGTIAEIGPGVEGRRVGERVIVGSRIACGTCSYCQQGRTADCRKQQHIGINRWGGYAEYVAVPARQAITLSDSFPFAEAAVAMRHFPMAFQQVDAKAALRKGETVLVMGASGGLGSAVVQVAKLRGATVIAGAGADERVAMAMSLGADHGINYRAVDLTERIMELTDGKGVDACFENISDPTTWPKAFASLAVHGRLVTSGSHGGGVVPVDMRRLYNRRLRIIGAAGYDAADAEKAMQAAGRGQLRAVVDLVLPLERLHDAFDLIGQRKVTGKVVIDPALSA